MDVAFWVRDLRLDGKAAPRFATTMGVPAITRASTSMVPPFAGMTVKERDADARSCGRRSMSEALDPAFRGMTITSEAMARVR
jgi:hypothetical protein